MKYKVTIRPAAERDTGDAQTWYENQRVGLGDEFLLSIADALIQLEDAAERFPLYHRDFRRVLATRFPYKIFFRIQGEGVIVYRILHAARDHAPEL